MRTPAAPTPADLVGAELLAYLQLRKGLSTPIYLQEPTAIPDGWATYTYRFQLLGRKRLPPELKGPMILRIYAGLEGLPRLRREWTFQSRLAACGYPVARPLWMEEDCDFLGGPFMVMEYVEGETLLNKLLHDYLALWWAPTRMAEAHVRLHRMPLHGLTAPARPFLDRSLEELQAAVDDYDLNGLAPGVAWLRAHRPSSEAPCIVHLDFHPLNLLMRDGQCAAVLDWSEADIGDRHADVGLALFLIDIGDVQEPSLWDRLVLPFGRWLTHWGYLYAYSQRLPLDMSRLRYFQAWAAMVRMTWYGKWLGASPGVMGFKATARSRLRPCYVAKIERYFEQYTGVRIRLGSPLRSTQPAIATH